MPKIVILKNGPNGIAIYEWDIPVGLDYCGTVHSHTSSCNLPSAEGMQFFKNMVAST
ncbi:MAG: hypothetical protein ACP5KJ_02910 [Candidatus Micrarchaeia archaeon]